MATKHGILAARPKIGTVDVPEWGGVVHLLKLSVARLLEFSELKGDGASNIDALTAMIVLSACDEEGRLLFGPDERDALRGQDIDVLKRVGDAVVELNGLGPAAGEAAAKNS